MKSQLLNLQKKAESAIKKAVSLSDLETAKTVYLGKKGNLTDILKGLSTLAPDQRPIIGQLANQIKQNLTTLIQTQQDKLEQGEWEQKLLSDSIDTTLPSTRIEYGTRHPINQVINEICALFNRLGFSIKKGPDIETDYYNFEALNIPADHPSRDMHDTFYLNHNLVLRTHTSPVQIHVMETQKPPLKIICPGKVYRCDSDITHSPVFHQIEGLYVDKGVTYAHLKGILEQFIHELFGKDRNVRFRPSYFPFTEPSTEIDVACGKCQGQGCSLCKNTGWIEILGAGMVHRNVFRAVGYDLDSVTGFAFGMGIERIAMLKYDIHDIRLFYENDIRFLRQF
ncbi:phenylalanine--tRNA ligase subunit alpha [Thermoproteota archaeon]